MIKRIHANDFRDELKVYGRDDNFSYDGAEVLFDYLEELDEDAELDIIEICCDWTECTLEYLHQHYDEVVDGEPMSDDDLLDMLRDKTTILQVDNITYIIQEF